MTSAVYATSVFSRRFLCQIRQRWFNARHTCSIVIAGFFFPQPIRVFGHKSHHDQTQNHVPHQRHITAPLEVAKADLAFDHPKRMLDVPARERHPQQFFQRRVSRCIRDEILHLTRRQVARHNQPIGAVRQFATPHSGATKLRRGHTSDQ